MMALPIVHFDISGPDEAALHRVYRGLFAWDVEPRGPGYADVSTPGGAQRGAIVENDEAGLVLAVGVPDLTAAVSRAVELGGHVVMEPVDNGWVRKATVSDPAGNRLTLIHAPGTA
jgi:predicted enzyme related to lactoylglutathione lyase